MQIYLHIFNKFKVNLCPVNNCLISIWSESVKSLVPQLGGDAACDLVHGGNDVCHDVDLKILVQKEHKFLG